MAVSIDHLGIAVKSLAAAKVIYEKLGLQISPEETVEQEKVRVAMVPVGESRVELLEATSEDSTIAKFIAERADGRFLIGLPGFVRRMMRTSKLMKAARRNAVEAGVTNVEFIKGTIEALPMPDASVDVVISNCVINLAADKPAVLREIARVLRPGGRVGVPAEC